MWFWFVWVLGLVFDGVMGWEHEWKHLHLDFFKNMAYIHWMIPGDLLQEVKVSERDGKHCMEDLGMMSEILVYNEYEMEATLL
jgi:hypothetical protein